jgi:hypothetical protein
MKIVKFSTLEKGRCASWLPWELSWGLLEAVLEGIEHHVLGVNPKGGACHEAGRHKFRERESAERGKARTTVAKEKLNKEGKKGKKTFFSGERRASLVFWCLLSLFKCSPQQRCHEVSRHDVDDLSIAVWELVLRLN